jgi:hydroxyacylglutathione hydrolase
MVNIVKLYHGGEECNTYVVGKEGEPCVVIDPGYNVNGSLDNYIEKHHHTCRAYLITHGHYDHIQGLASLTHQAPVFITEEDEACLEDPHLNVSDLGGQELVISGLTPYLVDDEDEIKLGNLIFKVIATPFHTAGSCCYYLESEQVLFSGDTLFHLGIGRTDLPGGSDKTVDSSLRKLACLPLSTKVYPGHGESTTIKNELAFNEAFQGLSR